MIQVRAEQFAVPSDDPFKNDLLGRKASAEKLTQFIELAQPPYVLALDSPWGTGKTTFLRMWLQALNNKFYSSIYFNAWENDFSDDPLVPIMVQFDAYVSEQNLNEELFKRATDYLTNAKTIGARLARMLVPAAIKVLTSGVIDVNKVVDETIADLSEKIVSAEIEAHKRDKSDLEKFKKNLQGLVGSLNVSKGQAENRPFLFVVDELDRCKPTYAVKLLERMKHVFDLDNVVFILSLDKSQLSHAIRAVYGEGMDIEGYLRKFIDIDYKLPVVAQKEFVLSLLKRCGLNEELSNRGGDVVSLREFMNELLRLFGCSLRDTEQCITRMKPANFVLRRVGVHGDELILLAVLILLRTRNSDLYQGYISDAIEGSEVIKFLTELPGGAEFMTTGKGIKVEAILLVARNRGKELNELRNKLAIQIQDAKSPVEGRELLAAKHKVACDLLNNHNMYILETIINAIEIADNLIS